MPDEDAPPIPRGFPESFGEGGGEEDALLCLACLRGITPRSLHALAWREGTASACVAAIRAGVAGSDNDRRWLDAPDLAEVRALLAAAGARFAPFGRDDYWPSFVRLDDPPIGVFLRGAPLGPGEDRVAVVGTRRPTALGREVGREIARGLAVSGVPVVSGGAIGIDAVAHRGALDAGGRTVAVLGSGIDVDYPRSNERLLGEVAASGTIVSEYPPGVPAEPHRFPARNRLIAALSRGVVVVEGAHRSGTRITAEHAIELGLDVFAVPGPVTSPLAETPLELIREGARLVRGAEDVLEDLGIEPVERPEGSAPIGLADEERKVFEALRTALLPDAVARESGLPMADAVGALMRLELRGLVRGSGGRYERTFAGARRSSAGRPPPQGRDPRRPG
ncbi:MAG: DNA-processing protein DprA [Actinomycetota bacterium]